jgi:hypothetical protein
MRVPFSRGERLETGAGTSQESLLCDVRIISARFSILNTAKAKKAFVLG